MTLARVWGPGSCVARNAASTLGGAFFDAHAVVDGA